MNDDTKMNFEMWVDNDGNPGLFVPENCNAEQLELLREGKMLAIFYGVTYEQAKAAFEILCGIR